jgi:hypothetical protein
MGGPRLSYTGRGFSGCFASANAMAVASQKGHFRGVDTTVVLDDERTLY